MRTKIIATYGPSSKSQIPKILKAGASIIRINTKYVNPKQVEKIITKYPKVKFMLDIKDRSILQELKTLKFHYLAISFAESAQEIKKIKSQFPETQIISKIENQKGLTNLKELLKTSDGIMIARGDLGRSIPFQKIPMIQKIITKSCNQAKKMSITATEMMPSMLKYTRPSRAETSDIANAILEGSEALMLAEETAIGKRPALAVEMMKKIIKETESHIKKFK
jgi:pyruvate kinase